MANHLVIGAGATARATALGLAAAGDTVLVISRRGDGPAHPRIERRAADAADSRAVVAAAAGVDTIFNCAMPRYDRWPAEFPALAAGVLAAARASGAPLVTLSNLYLYGAAPLPLTPATPIAPISEKGAIRAAIWEAARTSGVRATEVRAGDFLGHGAVSMFTLMVLPALRAGAPAEVPADLDAPHSWSFTGDVARTLIAAARHEASWGRAWHVPSSTASIRAVAGRLVELGGLPRAALSRMSRAAFAALAAGDSLVNAFGEMLYLFESPSVIEATETERVLGVRATPLDAVLRDTLRTTTA